MKAIILPEYNEMKKILEGIDPDPSLKNEFYPVLLKMSGEKIDSMKFVAQVGKALKRYVGIVNVDKEHGDKLYKALDLIISVFVSDKKTKAKITEEIKSIDLR